MLNLKTNYKMCAARLLLSRFPSVHWNVLDTYSSNGLRYNIITISYARNAIELCGSRGRARMRVFTGSTSVYIDMSRDEQTVVCDYGSYNVDRFVDNNAPYYHDGCRNLPIFRIEDIRALPNGTQIDIRDNSSQAPVRIIKQANSYLVQLYYNDSACVTQSHLYDECARIGAWTIVS